MTPNPNATPTGSADKFKIDPTSSRYRYLRFKSSGTYARFERKNNELQ